MDPAITAPPYDQLLEAAETAARERPDEVDLDQARDVFLEAATLLHNGLVLDGLDDHDARGVVAGLCSDLVTDDPGEAIRDRSRAVLVEREQWHDPESVSRSFILAAVVLKL